MVQCGGCQGASAKDFGSAEEGCLDKPWGSTKAFGNLREQYMKSSRGKKDPGVFTKARNALFLRHLRSLRGEASGQPRAPRPSCRLQPWKVLSGTPRAYTRL